MWKVISKYPLYEINEFGVVRNSITHYVTTQRMNRSGYLVVQLYDGEKNNMCLVHRLVAEMFIPNPENLPIVNHIDECCVHNSADNLEWISYKGNSNHGTRNERIVRNRKDAVLAFNEDGETIMRFSSKHEAGRALNVSEISIRTAIKKHNRCKSYFWRIDNNDETQVEIEKNLLWIEEKPESLRSRKTYNARTPVVAIDASGQIVKMFSSKAEAAREMNVSPTAIANAINTKTKCKSFFWEDADSGVTDNLGENK